VKNENDDVERQKIACGEIIQICHTVVLLFKLRTVTSPFHERVTALVDHSQKYEQEKLALLLFPSTS
jgi:hypothetical protein